MNTASAPAKKDCWSKQRCERTEAVHTWRAFGNRDSTPTGAQGSGLLPVCSIARLTEQSSERKQDACIHNHICPGLAPAPPVYNHLIPEVRLHVLIIMDLFPCNTQRAALSVQNYTLPPSPSPTPTLLTPSPNGATPKNNNNNVFKVR